MVNFSRDDIAKAKNNFYSEQKVEWVISDSPIPYEDAVAAMERRAALIAVGDEPECVWLLEHPPLYTAGSSADVADLIAPNRFPVHETRRGGQYTYHGPGQLVVYLMLDIKRRKLGVRQLVTAMEQAVVSMLADYGIAAYAKADAPGVYVHEQKVCSLGLRIRRGCSFHGLALNVDMDLSPFSRINPCGYAGMQMVNTKQLNGPCSVAQAQDSLLTALATEIGFSHINLRDGFNE
jgi:lipoyl(octanoyl) transferase